MLRYLSILFVVGLMVWLPGSADAGRRNGTPLFPRIYAWRHGANSQFSSPSQVAPQSAPAPAAQPLPVGPTNCPGGVCPLPGKTPSHKKVAAEIIPIGQCATECQCGCVVGLPCTCAVARK